VVGSFQNRDNAYKMMKKLQRKNIQATILEPNAGAEYYRVAVDDFETKDEAKDKLKDYKKTYGKSVWILSY
jgi:cell division protein FtsN